MNYMQKRNQIKVDRYTMSKKLGMSYERYCTIEKEDKPLPSDKLEKFLEIIKDDEILKEEKFENLNKFKDFYSLDSKGQSKATRIMKDLGISRQIMCKQTGISMAPISKLLNDFTSVSYETMYRVYDYLNDGTIIKDVENAKEEEVVEYVYSKNIDEAIYDFIDKPVPKIEQMATDDVKPSNDINNESNSTRMENQLLKLENKILREKLETIQNILNLS